MSALESLIIREENQFLSLADDWNRLASLTDPNSVFFRHEWSDASWQWLKTDGCELCVVCISRDGRLIGICPFVIRKIRRSSINLTEIAGLAIPDTQEFNILADSADLSDVLAGLIQVLRSGDVRWDIICLEKMPEDLHATELFENAIIEAGFETQRRKSADNPGIRLDGTWEEYYGRRSRRLKKGNNLVRNKLQRDGKEVEIQCFDGVVDDSGRHTLFNTLTELSASSWKASTGLTLDNPGPAAFLSRLDEYASTKGWLLAWLMTIDGEPAAMELQLQFNGVISGLRADYDEKFGDYSPGTLLNWRIIEKLFDRGAAYYALGPGSNPYKERWVEERRELADLGIYGKTLRARLIGVLDMRLRPLISRILKILGKQ